MAFVLFTILKAINKITSLAKKEADEAPAEEPEPSDEVKLLTEIAEQLKTLNKK